MENKIQDSDGKILIVCPTMRERRCLSEVAARMNAELLFDDFDGEALDGFLYKEADDPAYNLDVLRLIEVKTKRYRDAALSGVTSGVGYPGACIASALAYHLDLPGPCPRSVLTCEHKYYSRCAQQHLVPEATPGFRLIESARVENISFPFFLKPVKSCFSINAQRIDSQLDLEKCCHTGRMSAAYVNPLNDLISAYTDYDKDARSLLAETLLKGHQISLEGYVHNGEARIMGVLDAVMHPDNLCFDHFLYPSNLPGAVVQRMSSIARRFMTGIGYDNAPFNIEMMYDPDTDRINIIEVNPKIATQFTDLIHKVDGIDGYEVLLQLALGRRPDFLNSQGQFKVAGSFPLRRFKNARVASIPTASCLNSIRREYPDARIEIYTRPGNTLAQSLHEHISYRYAIINIGAQSRGELAKKFAAIDQRLEFEFIDCA